MSFPRTLEVLLLTSVLSLVSGALPGQTAQVLLDETFEDLALWTPGQDMNQNGWSTAVVSAPGVTDPVWYHQAHAAGNPGPTGNPSPKDHMVHRLGNTRLGQHTGGNYFGVSLHWRGLANDPDATFMGTYEVEVASPAFPSFPLSAPDDFMLTIKFDLAIDLLRENVPGFFHTVTVYIRDIPSNTLTPIVTNWGTSTRSDMTRHTLETITQPRTTNNDTSDWQLVIRANSNAPTAGHLYDYWLDNVKVLLDYHKDFSPPFPKDSYEDATDGVLNPIPPYPVIENNNTMAHPHYLGLLSFGAPPMVFPGAWVVDVDDDYYSLDVAAGVAFTIEVICDNLAEVELYRIETVEFTNPPGPVGKHVRARSVAFATSLFAEDPGHLVLSAQYYADVKYALRVTSIVGPGVLAPYNLIVTDIGTDWYDMDGEGPLGGNNNDSRTSATAVGTPYAAGHILHGGDEDWYLVSVPAGEQILVNVTDTSPFASIRDGIQVSLIRIIGFSPETRYADIDETGLGAWSGQRAEVAHIPSVSSLYLVRVWRYWQTHAARAPNFMTYDLSISVNSTPATRTIHVPASPAIITPQPLVVVLSLSTTTSHDWALMPPSTVGHDDHTYTWSYAGPAPVAPTPGPSGMVTANFVALPTGSLRYISITWDVTGAAPGIHAVVLFLREHLYDREASLDDLIATQVIFVHVVP